MSVDKLPKPTRIALIGSGTIGLSFAALHLTQSTDVEVTIYDTRPDLKEYIEQMLPGYLTTLSPTHTLSSLLQSNRLAISPSLPTAVSTADIIQEQGPESPTFKQSLWPQVETHCPPHALFWSSTSGIPASTQSIHMHDKSRLMVVHPYNPPHIMPLLELVPSPDTPDELVQRTLAYWKSLRRAPVLLKKETTGFVANRLAYALLREAVHLVQEGVVGVEELDAIVENSMGPRWTVAGPFKSYHMGGGQRGLRAFFEKIGGTVQDCWKDQGEVNVGEGWEERVFGETEEAYGPAAGLSVRERDERTKAVLEARGEGIVPRKTE
ncbi:hypothetical protein AJ79_07220 [Helicocarpus griseus UAMH5409]|uniref:L-gulonate 3-dehydrogenase n=1 Tax=Helicocarpus griseus UAMH5409 TaxID=1447875 RepID=A0A2B7X5G6_9EURO|nr:hypothetical protein AJ79_07220 [Helicocarpus griseus UAMH5409]